MALMATPDGATPVLAGVRIEPVSGNVVGFVDWEAVTPNGLRLFHTENAIPSSVETFLSNKESAVNENILLAYEQLGLSPPTP